MFLEIRFIFVSNNNKSFIISGSDWAGGKPGDSQWASDHQNIIYFILFSFIFVFFVSGIQTDSQTTNNNILQSKERKIRQQF